MLGQPGMDIVFPVRGQFGEAPGEPLVEHRLMEDFHVPEPTGQDQARDEIQENPEQHEDTMTPRV